MAVDQCAIQPKITPETIVDVFECIGQTSKTPEEANKRVTEFQDYLSDYFGLTEHQANLFGAEIFSYLPSVSSRASEIYQDLVDRMRAITKQKAIENNDGPVYFRGSTENTGLEGIDRLRHFGAGIMVGVNEPSETWPKLEVGSYIKVEKSHRPTAEDKLFNNALSTLPPDERKRLDKLSKEDFTKGTKELLAIVERYMAIITYMEGQDLSEKAHRSLTPAELAKLEAVYKEDYSKGVSVWLALVKRYESANNTSLKDRALKRAINLTPSDRKAVAEEFKKEKVAQDIISGWSHDE